MLGARISVSRCPDAGPDVELCFSIVGGGPEKGVRIRFGPLPGFGIVLISPYTDP